MKSPPYKKRIAFCIGRMQADCPGCGGREFARARRTRLQKAEMLICANCGIRHFRSALVDQIGRKIKRQADLAIENAAATLKRLKDGPGERR